MSEPTKPARAGDAEEKLIAELREQVARIIDPEGLRWAEETSGGIAEYIGTYPYSRCAIALAKAEAIHALYTTALEGRREDHEALIAAADAHEAISIRAEAAEAQAERAEAALRDIAAEIVSDPDDHGPQQGPAHLWAWAQARARSALSTLPAIVGGDISSCAETAAAGPSACAASPPHSQSEGES